MHVSPSNLVSIDTIAIDRVKEDELRPEFLKILKEVFGTPKVSSLCNKAIVLTGYIQDDGLGDWAHLITVAKSIKKAFPDQLIVLHPISADVHRDRLSLPKDIPCEITYESEISPEFFDKFKDAGKIVEVSNAISRIYQYNLQEPPLKALNTLYLEYNFRNNPSEMGFFAKGIHNRRIPRKANLEDLTNPSLKTLLFNSSNPSAEEVANYLSKHSLHLCYMHRDEFQFRVYFNTFLVAAIVKDDDHRNIDVIMPSLAHELKDITRLINKDVLLKAGVGVVKFITWKGGEKKETEFVVSDSDSDVSLREIRFIDTFPFSQKDMKLLMNFSRNFSSLLDRIIGCTGDDSIGRVLAYGMIPFYQIRRHKIQFFENLVKIAEEVLGKEAGYTKYLSNNLQIFLDQYEHKNYSIMARVKQMIEALENPNFLEQVDLVAKEIREKHNFNRSLIADLQVDMLMIYKQKLIRKLNKKYANREITIEEIKNKILKLIS